MTWDGGGFTRFGISIALLGLAALAGCSDSVSPKPSPAGSYVLVSVRGSVLPALIDTASGDNSSVTDGALVLGDRGTWNEFVTFRDVDKVFGVSEHVSQSSGTYAIAGDSIAFAATSPAFATWRASLNDSRLTFDFSAGPWTFQRTAQ